MKLTKLSLALLSATALTAGVANAAPTLKEVLGASGITASGYVDAGYSHFDTDAFGYNAFQTTQDTFDLQQAAVVIASQPKEGFGALVNVTAGSNAKPIASAGSNGGNNIDVTQAFVQYANGPVTVIAGKFATLMGAEVISPAANANVSHSIAFYNAIAYTHTGVRATYAVTDMLSLIGGVNNGWDVQQDNNTGKTLELGTVFSPSSMFSLAAQLYVGPESTATSTNTGTNARRSIIDVVATFKPIAPLSLVLNVDSAKQKAAAGTGTPDAKWTSVVGYVNYQISDKFRSSLRLEQFNDKDNYRLASSGVISKKVKSATLTGAYAPTANAELRAEYRMDKAADKVFTKDGAATNKANFFAVEALYKF